MKYSSIIVTHKALQGHYLHKTLDDILRKNGMFENNYTFWATSENFEVIDRRLLFQQVFEVSRVLFNIGLAWLNDLTTGHPVCKFYIFLLTRADEGTRSYNEEPQKGS